MGKANYRELILSFIYLVKALDLFFSMIFFVSELVGDERYFKNAHGNHER